LRGLSPPKPSPRGDGTVRKQIPSFAAATFLFTVRWSQITVTPECFKMDLVTKHYVITGDEKRVARLQDDGNRAKATKRQHSHTQVHRQQWTTT